jgi:protein O-mannosyl-transferase
MSKSKDGVRTNPVQNPSNNSQTEGDLQPIGFLKKYGIASIFLMFLCYFLYEKAIGFGYVLDDSMVITDNTFTKRGFGGLGDIFTTESFFGYFGENKALVQGSRYRPLSIATFAIEQGIVGEANPMLSHFLNILFYGLTCILFLMCCNIMFRKDSSKWYLSIGFFAALIFATHPVHVEAVANIKGRDEILTMMFSLGALYSALRYADVGKRSWLISMIVSFFLGMLSKENAITFAMIIPLTIYFYGGETKVGFRPIILSLLVTSAVFIIIRSLVVGQFIGEPATDVMNNPFLGMTGMERVGSTAYTLLKYIGLLFFPHPLSHDYYPYQIPKVSVLSVIPLLSVMFYSVLAYFAYKGWKSKSTYAYGILFFICALSIMANIVVNVGTFMNERFLFIPSAGFAIIVGYFLSADLRQRIPKIGAWIGLAAVVVICSAYSWKVKTRVPDWEDAMTLNLSAVKASPNSARANAFLATAYFKKFLDKKPKAQTAKEVKYVYDLLDSTEVYGNKAVKIIPDYANGNQMVIGAITERFKLEYDIKLYCRTMKPVILRRPDMPFIAEFSEYLKKTGNEVNLFSFYKEVGLELLKMKDSRKQWAVAYLAYAFEIKQTDREVVEGMAAGYYAAGRTVEAEKLVALAQSLK